jgi:hypothetical protein
MVVVSVVDVVSRMEGKSGRGRVVEVGENVLVTFPSLENGIVDHSFFIFS